MRRMLPVLGAALVLWVMCGTASARTWRVERDGSGDFTAIRPAIVAASAGDTIQIGPGRYDESAPLSLPGWTERTYVAVDKDDLTLRGTDRDAVIIGPQTSNFTTYGPKGIVTQVNVNRLRVENLTIEHVHDGLYLVGDVEIRDCRIQYYDLGIAGILDDRLLVEDTEFYWGGSGMFVVNPTQRLEVRRCSFELTSPGVSTDLIPLAIVEDCTFTGGSAGIQFDRTADGRVSRCQFHSVRNTSVNVIGGSSASVVGCTSLHGSTALTAGGMSTVVGTGNALQGTSYATIFITSRVSLQLSESALLPMSGLAVLIWPTFFGHFEVDLRHNYWGVETAEEIEALIHDELDDPATDARVLYEPFLLQSVPVEDTSFGELKARFGGGH